MSAARDELAPRAALAVGMSGIATFSAAVLSVTWLPSRLELVVVLAALGLSAFALAVLLAPR